MIEHDGDGVAVLVHAEIRNMHVDCHLSIHL